MPSLSAILDWHRQHYPQLEARDIYKLIHQGVFGPGHIISSAASAKRMLEEELAALEVRSPKYKGRTSEPVLEAIDPRGRLVRVNLRPFAFAAEGRSQKGRAERLVEAMVVSARRVKGDPRLMKRRLAAAVRWCRTNLPGEAVELERMSAQAEESGYPAFHHSSGYARAYRPAYRVILSDCVRRRASGRTG